MKTYPRTIKTIKTESGKEYDFTDLDKIVESQPTNAKHIVFQGKAYDKNGNLIDLKIYQGKAMARYFQW